MKKTKIALLATTIMLASNAYAANATDRHIYIGTELGIAEPVVNKFKVKSGDQTANFKLKRSSMISARAGYSFYPGMAIEFSYTRQPKYLLSYILPAHSFMSFEADKAPGNTKVSSDIFMLNLIYEMQEQAFGIKPYAIFGAGVAKMSIKPTTTSVIYKGSGFPAQEVFRIKKTNQNCFAWQAGLGISKDITENFSLEAGAKLQVVNNIKLKYDEMVAPNTYESKSIKKTIGVGEFTIGFKFKLPI